MNATRKDTRQTSAPIAPTVEEEAEGKVVVVVLDAEDAAEVAEAVASKATATIVARQVTRQLNAGTRKRMQPRGRSTIGLLQQVAR